MQRAGGGVTMPADRRGVAVLAGHCTGSRALRLSHYRFVSEQMSRGSRIGVGKRERATRESPLKLLRNPRRADLHEQAQLIDGGSVRAASL